VTIAEPGHSAPAHHAAKPRRKRLSATDRRASILAAATEVFAETGYHRGKVSDVAARLGVSEPVVFQNFGSKAALYAAVVDMAADHMCTGLESRFTATSDADTHTPQPTSVLDLFARLLAPSHLDWLHTAHAPGVLFADAISLAAEPDVAAAARRAVQRIAETLAGLLVRGQQNGEIRADLDPEAGAWSILTLLASHAFRAAVMPDRERLESELAQLTLRSMAAGPTVP
jgi:AcrR family transcriptional regulator